MAANDQSPPRSLKRKLSESNVSCDRSAKRISTGLPPPCRNRVQQNRLRDTPQKRKRHTEQGPEDDGGVETSRRPCRVGVSVCGSKRRKTVEELDAEMDEYWAKNKTPGKVSVERASMDRTPENGQDTDLSRSPNSSRPDSDTSAKINVVKLLKTLFSNIQFSRFVKALSEKLSECMTAVQILDQGKDGIRDTMAHLQELRHSVPYQKEHEVDVVQAQIKEKQDRLRRLHNATRTKRKEVEELRARHDQCCQDGRRRDARISDLMGTIELDSNYVLGALPPQFVVELRVCQESVYNLKILDQRLCRLDEEQAQATANIENAVSREFEVKWNDQEPEATYQSLPSISSSFLESTDLIRIAVDRDRLNKELEEARDRQHGIEEKLRWTAEDHFVSRGFLDQAISVLPAQKSSNDEKEDIKASNNVAHRDRGPHCTPTSPREQPQACKTRPGEDLSRVLTARLKIILRQELMKAENHLDTSEGQFHNMEHFQPNIGAEVRSTERNEAEACAYFLEQNRRTRQLIEAESAYESVARRAIAAGMLDVPPKSSGFSDQASDGYAQSRIDGHIASVDRYEITAWLEEVKAAKAPPPPYTVAGGSSEIPNNEPEGLNESDEDDLAPLDFGESVSTVAQNKVRKRINGVIKKWRAGEDGFWCRGRRKRRTYQ